jgi:hypothetical protein
MDIATTVYDPALDLFAPCRKASNTVAQTGTKG